MLLRSPRCTISSAPLRWGWGDRLCAAHFAVIMFGLVALVGPAHGAGAMLLAVGLVAVMCLAVHGASHLGIGVRFGVRLVNEAWTALCTAQFSSVLQHLRRASRLAGAPPAAYEFVLPHVHRRDESIFAFIPFYFSFDVRISVRGRDRGHVRVQVSKGVAYL
jgi:hypothetical protein